MLPLAGLAVAFLLCPLPAQTVGGAEDLFRRFDGLEVGEEMGVSLADLSDPLGLQDAGSAFVFTLNPILSATAETMSVSAGGTIDYNLDFPDQEAHALFRILVSWHGQGPSTLPRGLIVPLAMDGAFRKSLLGRVNHARHFRGILDSKGRALVRCQFGPNELPAELIGRTLFLAGVNLGFDFASVARRVDFTP